MKTYDLEIIKPILNESIFTKENRASEGIQVYYDNKEVKVPNYTLGKFFFFLYLGNGKGLKFIHYTKSIHNPQQEIHKIIKIQKILHKSGWAFNCDEEIVRVCVDYPVAGKTKNYYGYITDAHPDSWTTEAIRQGNYNYQVYGNEKVKQKIWKTCVDNNIWRPHLINEISKRKNYVINGDIKYIDIDPKFYFTSCNKRLRQDIIKEGQFPYSKRDRPYQSIEENGILGIRNMSHRYHVMQLGKYTFGGRTVLDIGCSIGGFCKLAKLRHAKHCTGIDARKEAVDVGRRFLDSEGHKGIDLFVYDINNGLEDLKALIGTKQFDYVFALSMLKHVDNKALFDIINYYTKEMCWIEGHDKQSKDDLQQILRENLASPYIYFIDYTYDRGKRPNFMVSKEKNPWEQYEWNTLNTKKEMES